MSASFYWRPERDAGVYVPVGGPSRFRETMERAFGSPPWHLAGGDVDKLRGMRAALIGEDDAFNDLVDAIDHHKAITVSVEY